MNTELTEKLDALANSWNDKAQRLAKAAFNEDTDEWLDDQTFGQYDALIDCYADLKRLIRSLQNQ